MKNPNHVPISRLMGSSLAASGIGYVVAPDEPLDKMVEQRGFFSTTTSQVLSATVDSLRNENKLLVFSYKGTAKVRAEIDGLFFFNGEQNLIVPAAVNYFLDLSQFTLADVVRHSIANYRSPALTSDITVMIGNIMDKYIDEDGRHMIAVDCRMANQNGAILATARAKIELPKKPG